MSKTLWKKCLFDIFWPLLSKFQESFCLFQKGHFARHLPRQNDHFGSKMVQKLDHFGSKKWSTLESETTFPEWYTAFRKVVYHFWKSEFTFVKVYHFPEWYTTFEKWYTLSKSGYHFWKSDIHFPKVNSLLEKWYHFPEWYTLLESEFTLEKWIHLNSNFEFKILNSFFPSFRRKKIFKISLSALRALFLKISKARKNRTIQTRNLHFRVRKFTK